MINIISYKVVLKPKVIKTYLLLTSLNKNIFNNR